jgi:hypothetical protein
MRVQSCPLLQGEGRLQLLNYQNNFISRISNLNKCVHRSSACAAGAVR